MPGLTALFLDVHSSQPTVLVQLHTCTYNSVHDIQSMNLFLLQLSYACMTGFENIVWNLTGICMYVYVHRMVYIWVCIM